MYDSVAIYFKRPDSYFLSSKINICRRIGGGRILIIDLNIEQKGNTTLFGS